MKAYFIFMILVSGSFALNAQCQHPKVMIYTYIDKTTVKNEIGLLELYSDHLIAKFRHEIKKEFPCVNVFSVNDINVAIRHDRDRTMLNPNSESYLNEIAGAMGADYLISIELKSDGRMTSLNSSMVNTSKEGDNEKENKILKSKGENVFDEMDEYVKNYVREMAKNEICPYKGSFISVTESDFKDEKQNQYDSEDGKSSSSYHFSHIIKQTDSWELEKIALNGAKGNMKHHQTDLKKITSSTKGRCLKYENGVWIDIFKGWGNSSENFEETYKSDLNGLANENDIDTKYPAVIQIKFDVKNGTYHVIVKAVSQTGTEYKSVYHQMNYSCPGPPFKTINEKDIPYPKVVDLRKEFGPYPGKPTDKTLTQTVISNEVREDGKGKSKQTITFRFSR